MSTHVLSSGEWEAFVHFVSWGHLKRLPHARRHSRAVQLTTAKDKLGLSGRSSIECLAWTLVHRPDWVDESSPIAKALGATLHFSRLGRTLLNDGSPGRPRLLAGNQWGSRFTSMRPAP